MHDPTALRKGRLAFAILWSGTAFSVAAAAIWLSNTLTDRLTFGQRVSNLFQLEAWFALICVLGFVFLLSVDKPLEARQRRGQLIVAGVGLACILGYFGLQPVMAALREGAGPGGVMASSARQQFGMLHGLSMLLYLVQTVMAVWLLIKSRK